MFNFEIDENIGIFSYKNNEINCSKKFIPWITVTRHELKNFFDPIEFDDFIDSINNNKNHKFIFDSSNESDFFEYDSDNSLFTMNLNLYSEIKIKLDNRNDLCEILKKFNYWCKNLI